MQSACLCAQKEKSLQVHACSLRTKARMNVRDNSTPHPSPPSSPPLQENSYWHSVMLEGYKSRFFQTSRDLLTVYEKRLGAREVVSGIWLVKVWSSSHILAYHMAGILTPPSNFCDLLFLHVA